MKVNRKIIEIDEELCDGCGQCILSCAEGALQLVGGKAKVIADRFCDGLGACLGECPTGALKIVEREAEDFDEAAVEAHLAEKEAASSRLPMGGGCPSAGIQTFIAPKAADQDAAAAFGGMASALTHWPVQIRLVPPTAPFLKGADLLVVADCVPVAFPALHRDLLGGRTVMMGCPKFDEVQAYVDKFSDIFKTAGIRRITIAIMEVPCCAGLPAIVKKALENAETDIPLEQIIISTRGEILNRGLCSGGRDAPGAK